MAGLTFRQFKAGKFLQKHGKGESKLKEIGFLGMQAGSHEAISCVAERREEHVCMNEGSYNRDCESWKEG